MARRSKPPLASLIEAIGPPISSTAWSPKFTAQTLEVLPVGLSDGALFWMKPLHADSLRVGLPPSATPADVVLDVLKWYPLAPVVVHSTSWRHEEGRIILTYVAVVQKPTRLPPDSLAITPVKRAELARGEAMAAPKTIGGWCETIRLSCRRSRVGVRPSPTFSLNRSGHWPDFRARPTLGDPARLSRVAGRRRRDAAGGRARDLRRHGRDGRAPTAIARAEAARRALRPGT